MDEKTFRVLVAATAKGAPRTWTSLDTSARWVRRLGIGTAQLDVSRWQPAQRELTV
jgi:hypothetical protein